MNNQAYKARPEIANVNSNFEVESEGVRGTSKSIIGVFNLLIVTTNNKSTSNSTVMFSYVF